MTESFLKIGTTAVLTAAVSGVLVYGLIRLNRYFGLTADPRGDRWHRQATPNSGGVAVFLSCLLGYVIAFRGAYSSVALGAAAIFLLGFLDDRFGIRPLFKLLTQGAIAAAVVVSGVIFPATSSVLFNWMFSFLWIVGLTNAFNLIDNIDGLCAGVTIVICSFRIFALATTGHWTEAGLAAMVGAAFAGFLIFNYSPARIFMGDCGSMFAGFTLSALAIASSEAHTKAFAAGFFYPALTFTYPIFDTLLVSFLRRAAGRPISVGGRDHSSHRLVYLGMGEKQAVWILWGLTALGSAIGLMTRWMPLEVIAIAALLVTALCMFGIFLSTLPPYQVQRDSPFLRSGLRKHIPTLRAGVILLVDSFLAGVAFFISWLANHGSDGTSEDTHGLLITLPIIFGFHGLVSCLSRTFDISWRWFGLTDIFRLVRASVLGAGTAGLGLLALGVNHAVSTWIGHCILCTALIAGARASLRGLQFLFEVPRKGQQRAAIFGVGAESRMLAILLPSLEVVPVLFLDNTDSIKGLRIHGIPVRGYRENWRDLVFNFQIQSVFIAGPFDHVCHASLSEVCADVQVKLRVLDVTVRDAPDAQRT